MNLSPWPVSKFFDNDGEPMAAGLLYIYAAGTTTKLSTWQDSAGASLNSNPIVLNFRGECRVWLDPALSYKFVLSPPTDTDPPTNPIWTVDNITAGPASTDNAALDTGTANTVLLSIPRLASTPAMFDRIVWKSNFQNTGATSVVINGGLSKSLLWQNRAALSSGALQVDGMYQAIYDGLTWQLQGPTLDPTQMITIDEFLEGVTIANYAYLPGDARRYGYVADGVDGSDTGTDNATAIADCIAANWVTVLPAGVGKFSGSITLPVGKTITGQGPRATTLRQVSTATTAGIILGDVVSADITDGSHRIMDLCLKTAPHAGAHGIRIGDGATAVNASMLDFRNLRIWSQRQETNPTSPLSGQRGIYIQSASSAVFLAPLRLVEIRCFDIGIDSSGSAVSANEWAFQSCWLLDCRVAVSLSNCSTWNLSGVTVESAVSNAICLQTANAVSNILWNGGRWELTATGGFGVSGDGSTTGQNWRFSGITVLINGDGSANLGRKFNGTIPADTVFEGYTASGPFMRIPGNATTWQIPNLVKMGGLNLGNPTLTFERTAGGASATVSSDASGDLFITAGNSLRLRAAGTTDDRLVTDGTRLIFTGADTATGYTAAVRFGGNSFVWVDSSGRLRIKSGTPTSDTDGTVVGTQT